MKVEAFHEFLRNKGVDVLEGRIPIDQAGKVIKLESEYAILKAKAEGLPKELEPFGNKVVEVDFDGMERKNQGALLPQYSCSLVSSYKNYDDDDTCGIKIKGTVSDIWKWALAESGLDPEEVIDSIWPSILLCFSPSSVP